MSKNKKGQKETVEANYKLNEEFYKGEIEINRYDQYADNKVEEANNKINEKFYSDDNSKNSNPTSYLYNNMAAVDVTEDKDAER